VQAAVMNALKEIPVQELWAMTRGRTAFQRKDVILKNIKCV
jgi:hypothetical protein